MERTGDRIGRHQENSAQMCLLLARDGLDALTLYTVDNDGAALLTKRVNELWEAASDSEKRLAHGWAHTLIVNAPPEMCI